MKVYLDYNSTSPVDERVVKAMEPFYSVRFGNPASLHAYGEDAKYHVEEAREHVASIIGAKSDKIYFTNSATEANNIVLKGRFYNKRQTEKDAPLFMITTNTEHASINKTIQRIMQDENLYHRDFYAPYIKIKDDGNIDLNELDKLIDSFKDRLLLVSIIAANNEIGTIHDLEAIGHICYKYNVLFHTDATQAIGKIDIDVDAMNIFALTMSGHKIYGPKGVGALYVRDESLLEPLIDGGYQNTLSSGTQNVPAIVGLGEACRILNSPDNQAENGRMMVLRDLLLNRLLKGIPDLIINGTMKNRLPNNLNVTIKDIHAEILIRGMDDVIISGGAACKSGSIDPSDVIIALGNPYPDCAIRISVGRSTSSEEIEYAASRIIGVVNQIRGNKNEETD